MLLNFVKKITRPNSFLLSQMIKSPHSFKRAYTFCIAKNDIQSFADIDILIGCKQYLVDKFPTLTQIQQKTLKTIIEGHDLIGVAKTGSGKTLAYGLPALMNAQKRKTSGKQRSKNPLILVISPTRQLAVQIEQHLTQLCQLLNLRITSVYGGKQKYHQIRKLKAGTDILIATPGRLLDFVYSDVLKLRQIEYVVLDEADRILDIGFEQSLKKILKQLPQKRQTLLFSATFDKQIRQLAKQYTKNAVSIQIGESGITLNSDIEQKFIIKSDKPKDEVILDIIAQNKDKKIIIFTNTKLMCKTLSQDLYANKIRSTYLNGDLTQQSRENNLNSFKQNRVNILIATDVAARGLDINDVNIIINYDNPIRLEDYVHRIGRTGRAGKKGQSITFLNKSVSPSFLRDLKKVFQKSKIPVPIDLENFSKQLQDQGPQNSSRNNRNYSQRSGNYQNRSRDSFQRRSFGENDHERSFNRNSQRNNNRFNNSQRQSHSYTKDKHQQQEYHQKKGYNRSTPRRFDQEDDN